MDCAGGISTVVESVIFVKAQSSKAAPAVVFAAVVLMESEKDRWASVW